MTGELENKNASDSTKINRNNTFPYPSKNGDILPVQIWIFIEQQIRPVNCVRALVFAQVLVDRGLDIPAFKENTLAFEILL